MKRSTRFRPHSVTCETRPDGTLLMQSNTPLGEVVQRTGDWLHHWAETAPDRVFLAERSGAGWRCETYRSTLQKVRAIGQALLARGMGQDTRIILLSGNGVDHGLITLAAQYVGVPTVPLAEQYSLISEAHARLVQSVGLIKPHMVYVVDEEQFSKALALPCFEGTEVVASRPSGPGVTGFDDLLKGDPCANVDAAFDALTPESIAKILMTSGSTATPKGVLTTHRMMCTNQTQLADSFSLLQEHRPCIVDWLPWNHVFGGSHNFNMMLANGGSLFIDDGKPTEALFGRTLENLHLVAGTLAFNVPLGFDMLFRAMQSDKTLRHRYFEKLDLIFYAGASLAQSTWAGLEAMAMEIRGQVPLMTSSWGLTETAPSTMIQQEPTDRSGVVGVPASGVTVKLIPDGGGRFEIRVKGPNVMPGYFNAPEQTANAFDGDGFFITGDAMVFNDITDPDRGMRFDGRMAEDFKLRSGTWVRAAQLRTDLLASLTPLAADIVITGQDRNDIGVMIFPDFGALRTADFSSENDGDALIDPALLSQVRQRLIHAAEGSTGSSNRVARAIVLACPPLLASGEVTAKGNLNYRRIQTLRHDLVNRLYDSNDSGIITL